jgi:pimeloyl-ACP methyl ester carboxylesterase
MGVLFGSDFVFWAWQTYAGSSLMSVMGIPADVLARPRPMDEPLLAEVWTRFLPISGRTAGALNDLYLTNQWLKDYPFERIAVPTLVITAVDDTLAPYDVAKPRAERIPGVRFVTLDRGGHLLLGQQERVKAELADFLGSGALRGSQLTAATVLGQEPSQRRGRSVNGE